MRIPKTFLCTLLTAAMLFTGTSTVRAAQAAPEEGAQTLLSQQAYGQWKEEGRQKGLSEDQVAKEALIRAGFPAGVVGGLSHERLKDVYLNQSITTTRHYMRVAPDGTKTELSAQACKAEMAVQEQRDTMLSAFSLMDFEDTKQNAYIEISIGAMKLYDKNNKPIPGEYGYYAAVYWLKMPVWRGTDVIGIASSAGAIKTNSGECSAYYEYSQVMGNTVQHYDYENYYNASSSNYDHFLTALAFRVKLPPDISAGSNGTVKYNVMQMLVYGEGIVPDKYSNCNYNVSSQYFHQSFTLIGSLSVNLNGANLSVSPSLFYDSSYPRATITIRYYP